jgi:xylan 1,4-beta-xylosidase
MTGSGRPAQTPVIPGFYPDPSICRAGDTYYTAHSSFEYAPGVPIFRSTDLVTWSQVGNALTRPSQLTPSIGTASSGVYAPTIRYGQGRFWLVTTDIGEFARGHLLVSAEDPAGPWSDAAFVTGTLGIDPDLTWDEDGVCRLTWKSFDPARPGILSAPVDPVAGRLLGEPQPLWQGLGMQSPEGPHLYRIDGWWYLLLAEGGTERGHTVTLARTRDLRSTWEEAPSNPVLTHRSTDHPVQNVGHADLVQRPDGSWAMVYHGVRPRGQTPHFHVNGRETFVAGVDWVDGWPVVRQDAFAVPTVDHSFTDRFRQAELHPRWVAPGVAPSSFATSTPDGVRLDTGQVLDGGPTLLAVRAQDREWTARVRLTTQGTARLVVRMDSAHWYGVTVTPQGIEGTLAIGPAVSTIGPIPRPTTSAVVLRVSAKPAAPGLRGPAEEPDLIELAAVGTDGSEHVFGSFAGRYLSTEVAGGFTGRVVGIEVLDGSALVHEFGYRTDDATCAPGTDGARYDLAATTLETLLEDPESRAVFDELMPQLPHHPFIGVMRTLPLDALFQNASTVPDEVVADVRARLGALSPHRRA